MRWIVRMFQAAILVLTDFVIGWLVQTRATNQGPAAVSGYDIGPEPTRLPFRYYGEDGTIAINGRHSKRLIENIAIDKGGSNPDSSPFIDSNTSPPAFRSQRIPSAPVLPYAIPHPPTSGDLHARWRSHSHTPRRARRSRYFSKS
jgi:hypothetical protein